MLDTAIARNASYLIQRKIIHPQRRDALARMLGSIRPHYATLDSTLTTEGLVSLGNVLTAEQITDIRAALRDKPLHDPYKKALPDFTIDDLPVGVHLGQYTRSDAIRAPHLLELANRPDILARAAAVIGAKPTIHDFLVWWSFPGPEKPADSQFWHRDCADWKMVKLFVYLTDVDSDSGPHIYAPGSVHSDKLVAVRRYADEEVEPIFQPAKILGPAGSAIMTNPRGLHRATLPRAKRRLVFEASYGLMGLPNVTYGSIEKIRRPDLDPWVNRFFVH